MKNNVTEIVFILDRSGSMSGFEGDTIGGFNSTLNQQKEKDGKAYVTTVLFDNFSTTVHDRLPINEVKPMTVADYRVGGCTALLDALGETICHIGNIHKYARPEDVPEHTIFVIITDGMENASQKFNSDTVKKMIKEKQENYGWEFIFLAANIDAVQTADTIGIRPERAVNFKQTKKGMGMSFSAVSSAISTMRCSESLDNMSWREKLDKDNKK